VLLPAEARVTRRASRVCAISSGHYVMGAKSPIGAASASGAETSDMKD
jgi:hypothetical protein